MKRFLAGIGMWIFGVISGQPRVAKKEDTDVNKNRVEPGVSRHGIFKKSTEEIDLHREALTQGDMDAYESLCRCCQNVVGESSDFIADHQVLIGDSRTLPFSKQTILYALQWVRADYMKKSESILDAQLKKQYRDLVPTLNLLLTILARDWHEIEAQDAIAILKLNSLREFPDWALPLRDKYLNDDRASAEAAHAVLQVMIDRAGYDKRQPESLEKKVAELLGDNADQGQIKAVAEKIRADFDKKGAEALARITARQANGQKF